MCHCRHARGERLKAPAFQALRQPVGQTASRLLSPAISIFRIDCEDSCRPERCALDRARVTSPPRSTAAIRPASRRDQGAHQALVESDIQTVEPISAHPLRRRAVYHEIVGPRLQLGWKQGRHAGSKHKAFLQSDAVGGQEQEGRLPGGSNQPDDARPSGAVRRDGRFESRARLGIGSSRSPRSRHDRTGWRRNRICALSVFFSTWEPSSRQFTRAEYSASRSSSAHGQPAEFGAQTESERSSTRCTMGLGGFHSP